VGMQDLPRGAVSAQGYLFLFLTLNQYIFCDNSVLRRCTDSPTRPRTCAPLCRSTTWTRTMLRHRHHPTSASSRKRKRCAHRHRPRHVWPHALTSMFVAGTVL
jgi:hypothetical protein